MEPFAKFHQLITFATANHAATIFFQFMISQIIATKDYQFFFVVEDSSCKAYSTATVIKCLSLENITLREILFFP